MLNIIFGFATYFFLFYAINYVGQKFITKKETPNHKIIVIVSAIETIAMLILTYNRIPF
ncbi:hypothetical protein [Peribacillus muralis]|uniref:hypothetical protein n=1 Tax=Peribacillus muralis TaxID=264697 RepID=UPI003D047846